MLNVQIVEHVSDIVAELGDPSDTGLVDERRRAVITDKAEAIRRDLEKIRSAMLERALRPANQSEQAHVPPGATQGTFSMREVDEAVADTDRLLGVLTVRYATVTEVVAAFSRAGRSALHVIKQAIDRAPQPPDSHDHEPDGETSESCNSEEGVSKSAAGPNPLVLICTVCGSSYLPEVPAEHAEQAGGGHRRGRCQDCRSHPEHLDDLVDVVDRVMRGEPPDGTRWVRERK